MPRDLLWLALRVTKKERLGVTVGRLAQKHFNFFIHIIETEMLKIRKRLFKYIFI